MSIQISLLEVIVALGGGGSRERGVRMESRAMLLQCAARTERIGAPIGTCKLLSVNYGSSLGLSFLSIVCAQVN